MKIDKLVKHSEKVKIDDLDWDLARRIGLTDREVLVLTYFADIEGQTIYYLREILNTRAAQDPDVAAFVTIWNYEEYFHSLAIAKLLRVCGRDLGKGRNTEVRASIQLSAFIEDGAQKLMSKIFPGIFPALVMCWGASQELLTLRGYEEISKTTKNPVLAELCRRIAKQERKHFAWYYNNSKKRLTASKGARRLTRLVFEKVWSPVGAGVKSDEEVALLCHSLFPNGRFAEVAQGIDEKLGGLPGMENFSVVRRFAESLPSSELEGQTYNVVSLKKMGSVADVETLSRLAS